MAQDIEITAESAPTPTAKLFALGSDTVLYTASSVTEATNRNIYTATFTGVVVGTYLMVLYTAGTKFANRYVHITSEDGTFTEVNDGSTNVIGGSFSYSPADPASTFKFGVVWQGQGTPLDFYADPPTPVDVQYFEVRLGTPTDNVKFNDGNGRLVAVDASIGHLRATPTIAETTALPIPGSRIQLWRIGPGDPNVAPTCDVYLTVKEGLL